MQPGVVAAGDALHPLQAETLPIVGFRNRRVVPIRWAWEYFLYDRAGRLITSPPRKEKVV